MIATYGYEGSGSEEGLSRSSDSSNRSFLFRTSNDSMTLVLSYLDVQSICHIDIAVSNAAERHIWWTSLSLNHLPTFSEHEHCKESIRWLVKRDIRLERLKTKDMKWESDRINWSTLLGLNMSSLQYINVQRCSIGDEEVLLIAHGCPHLSEIDIFDCKNITDVGISYLAASCSEMSNINLDNCSLITDVGVSIVLKRRQPCARADIPSSVILSQ